MIPRSLCRRPRYCAPHCASWHRRDIITPASPSMGEGPVSCHPAGPRASPDFVAVEARCAVVQSASSRRSISSWSLVWDVSSDSSAVTPHWSLTTATAPMDRRRPCHSACRTRHCRRRLGGSHGRHHLRHKFRRPPQLSAHGVECRRDTHIRRATGVCRCCCGFPRFLRQEASAAS